MRPWVEQSFPAPSARTDVLVDDDDIMTPAAGFDIEAYARGAMEALDLDPTRECSRLEIAELCREARTTSPSPPPTAPSRLEASLYVSSPVLLTASPPPMYAALVRAMRLVWTIATYPLVVMMAVVWSIVTTRPRP